MDKWNPPSQIQVLESDIAELGLNIAMAKADSSIARRYTYKSATQLEDILSVRLLVQDKTPVTNMNIRLG
jgi:hypothetical protein